VKRSQGPLKAKAMPVEELTLKRIGNFWSKVTMTDGCWIWQGSTTQHPTHPYGRFRLGEHMVVAHRVSYFLSHDEDVPRGLVVDHLCKTTLCVNPAHLEVVTQQENLNRGSRYA
jgi:hypothetical protein